MGVPWAKKGEPIDPGHAVERLRAVAALVDPAQGAPHEIAALRFAAGRVAALLGLERDEAGAGPGLGRYWLPLLTLSYERAAEAGIFDESRLWGGVVPFEFVATKLVSHALWRAGADAPAGWRALPGIEDCTLPGHSVFGRQDAAAAGGALLRGGDIRLKCPFARGGHGQAVIRDARQLSQWLDAADDALLARGLVIERDLARCVTYSVGSTRLPGHEIAYHGRQRNVADRQGREVYGGSVLTVHRGGPAELCAALEREPQRTAETAETVAAVRAAMRYDRLVRDSYGVLASRCNYDVIAGVDARGRRHLGVLEQSWRFGGASMAEVLAMERFAQRPALPWTVAETVEAYGDDPPPADAVVYWPGDAGSPRKYARIVRDGR